MFTTLDNIRNLQFVSFTINSLDVYEQIQAHYNKSVSFQIAAWIVFVFVLHALKPKTYSIKISLD